ncbi:hypothetical protein C2838_05445 [Pasteurella multocida]|uniref:Uncharacterized protein n=1 Tax=Haemophilus parainfluenzae TaxID=729 RepID=A0AB36E851_HAEPA|nr:hypothetical protein CGSHi7P49H1_06391 [Haemophilus influenzae 7P49H1]NNI14006.1 hypothetical protein [Pasteurella multocida]NNI18260.1 hypothetical protein [Pasteurella multocida]OBY51268.1 hypothetical protein BBB48_07680 [Haemophilus parainfluenzae]
MALITKHIKIQRGKRGSNGIKGNVIKVTFPKERSYLKRPKGFQNGFNIYLRFRIIYLLSSMYK